MTYLPFSNPPFKYLPPFMYLRRIINTLTFPFTAQDLAKEMKESVLVVPESDELRLWEGGYNRAIRNTKIKIEAVHTITLIRDIGF